MEDGLANTVHEHFTGQKGREVAAESQIKAFFTAGRREAEGFAEEIKFDIWTMKN